MYNTDYLTLETLYVPLHTLPLSFPRGKEIPYMALTTDISTLNGHWGYN